MLSGAVHMDYGVNDPGVAQYKPAQPDVMFLIVPPEAVSNSMIQFQAFDWVGKEYTYFVVFK